jgi:hypothetical protein
VLALPGGEQFLLARTVPWRTCVGRGHAAHGPFRR